MMEKMTGLSAVQLTSNREISPGVHLIAYQRNTDFQPGQVVRITLDPAVPPRIYSICSGPHEAEIRILFNVKEDGWLTPRLARCRTNDTIWVSSPYGSFFCAGEPAWWIATGTGIAPFYSMFRAGWAGNKRLIHGARYLNQFYFAEELKQEMGNRYIRCCSREQGDDVFSGSVSDYLQQGGPLPREVKYYLCGKALMVVEVRDLLIAEGIPYENILAEIYF